MTCSVCDGGGCGACGACEFAPYKGKAQGIGKDACTPFELLGAKELCLFDSIIETQMNIIGTPIEWWHQDIKNSIRDPLYDEPIERRWKGPYRLKAFVEYIPGEAEMREEGFRVTWNGTMFITRKSIEEVGAPSPLEGDVIRYWSNKFFKEHATGGNGDPGGDYYFDVINVDDDAHVFDSANFLGFKLTLYRRTEFSAERRLAEGTT